MTIFRLPILAWNNSVSISVIFIFSLVVLWLIFRKSQVVKLNINIQSDILLAHHSSVDVRSMKPTVFQLIWPRTKEFPVNWDDVILKLIRSREHFAVSLQLLG